MKNFADKLRNQRSISGLLELEAAMAQARLKRAGITLGEDFFVTPSRKFPKYLQQFVDHQMSLFDAYNAKKK